MTWGCVAYVPQHVWPEDSLLKPLPPSLCDLRPQSQLVCLCGRCSYARSHFTGPNLCSLSSNQPVVFRYSSRKKSKTSGACMGKSHGSKCLTQAEAAELLIGDRAASV